MAKRPVRITLRTYQVGFGDCFLLGFHYPGDDSRHVLIDFGSTGLPKKDGKSRAPRSKEFNAHMTAIAQDVGAACGGRLHAVVATHRHADHVNGFTTEPKGTGSGTVIAALKPKFVLQPWTETPDLAPDAEAPAAAAAATPSAGTPKGFTALLGNMQLAAAAVSAETAHLALGEHVRGVAELRFLGEDNVANRSAVENLAAMGNAKGAQARYLSAGKSARMSLPGVKVHVLGPPTVKQSAAIRKQRSSDETQFWMLLGATAERFSAMGGSPLPQTGTVAGTDVPPPVRWLRDHVLAARAETLLPIVRSLDQAMNNTSLILVFEVGRACLLFPGDAQIENWEHALSQPRNQALVARTTFYKVGHHGSRNATPKAGLWDRFANRTKAADKRLWSVVSTMGGKHGSASRHTEVPRKTLVDALAAETAFRTTQTLRERKTGVPCRDFEIDPATGAVTEK